MLLRSLEWDLTGQIGQEKKASGSRCRHTRPQDGRQVSEELKGGGEGRLEITGSPLGHARPPGQGSP